MDPIRDPWDQLEKTEAEIARLRKALLWATQHAELTSKGTGYANTYLVIDAVRTIEVDGTDESLIETLCRLAEQEGE